MHHTEFTLTPQLQDRTLGRTRKCMCPVSQDLIALQYWVSEERVLRDRRNWWRWIVTANDNLQHQTWTARHFVSTSNSFLWWIITCWRLAVYYKSTAVSALKLGMTFSLSLFLVAEQECVFYTHSTPKTVGCRIFKWLGLGDVMTPFFRKPDISSASRRYKYSTAFWFSKVSNEHWNSKIHGVRSDRWDREFQLSNLSGLWTILMICGPLP